MGSKSVEILSAARLFGMINWANNNLAGDDRLAELECIGEHIKASVPSLSGKELAEVSARFSAAFKPLGKKPPSAVEVILLIDRTVMSGYINLPRSESTPHPVVAEASAA